MAANSLPKTVTRQRHDCDLNPGPSVPESSTLTTRLLSHPDRRAQYKQVIVWQDNMPTDRGGSTSMHRRICSLHSPGGLA